MFLVDGEVRWSASDLTAAASCEYAVLRRLDVLLGRATRLADEDDLLQARVAELGHQHEARLLDELTADPASLHVVELGRAAAPYTEARLRDLHARTLAAFDDKPDVVFQAGFYDGDFHGYADFVRRTDEGWVVCDAKLARQARPTALLQLGAYADQVARAGLPLAPDVALLLGDGVEQRFPCTDVLPVFRERAQRLREILAAHAAEGGPVVWGDDRYVACGRCPECHATASDPEVRDLVLVAGMRTDQRRRFREEGVRSVRDLARATEPPHGMLAATFDRLRAQARLQLTQLEAEPDAAGEPQVSFELLADAGVALRRLPAPSAGDLFFDFEGDPLYHEGDLSRWGLEYLWGVMTAPGPGQREGDYTALWAHDSAQERAAFVAFMEMVAERRATHPDMHIYHYAPYETSALKRLASTHLTHERELDDLLRSAVFVDLYAAVRGAVRVSQPSYSIKKLEPLYMSPEERRTGDVQAGDLSIAEYHAYRDVAVADPARAQETLDELEAYNRYDCLSTLRLRNWLLERAEDAGVHDQIGPRAVDRTGEADDPDDPLFLDLMARCGSRQRSGRSPEERAYALLAAALDYHRREDRPWWWAHYARLAAPLEDWVEKRDVFRVDSATVVEDWSLASERSRNPRRVVELVGAWGPGSTPGRRACVVYGTPTPPGVELDADAQWGCAGEVDVLETDDPGRLRISESVKPDRTHDLLPVALVPAYPLHTGPIADAIRAQADRSLQEPQLPHGAVLDLLARRPPRTRDGATLPDTGDAVRDVTTALLAMDDSYVAVQGPPGSGKTWTGSLVVRALVEEHGWRVGVVAQSHAVVEHMLDAVVDAGLDPALVAKTERRYSERPWRDLRTPASREAFVEEHAGSGCVLGGTAWTFSASGLVGQLDLVVVDEAGQFALAPTIAVARSASRLLLLGDPQQLPQVSQGTHPEPVDTSALGWLMQGHDTLPPELGYFLATSYRMHPTLCAKISALSYDGRLEADPSTTDRALDGVAPGLRVVALPHQDNRTESVEEADEVVRQVRSLLGTSWHDPADSPTRRPLGESDVLVVAPYNAQVNLIRGRLDAAGLDGVLVGTVDKFQGRQAPVVIVSMTASSHGDVPRGMGFLLDRHRINVAVSRAQWLAVLLRSEALTAFMPSSTRGLLELGAFIGLCAAPE